MMVHDDDDSSNMDSSCTPLQPIPRWVLGRGQLANIHHGPTEALLLAYPAPAFTPANIPVIYQPFHGLRSHRSA
jgi:hypothetical protein